MKQKISETSLKEAYYYLSKNKVQVTTLKCGFIKDYTFGECVMHVSTHVTRGVTQIYMTERRNPLFSMSLRWENPNWYGKSDSKLDKLYRLYIAVKNKSEGKEYIDPYANKPIEKVANNSAKILGKMIIDKTPDLFPYNYLQDLKKYRQIINETKLFFAQKIRENYK